MLLMTARCVSKLPGLNQSRFPGGEDVFGGGLRVDAQRLGLVDRLGCRVELRTQGIQHGIGGAVSEGLMERGDEQPLGTSLQIAEVAGAHRLRAGGLGDQIGDPIGGQYAVGSGVHDGARRTPARQAGVKTVLGVLRQTRS